MAYSTGTLPGSLAVRSRHEGSTSMGGVVEDNSMATNMFTQIELLEQRAPNSVRSAVWGGNILRRMVVESPTTSTGSSPSSWKRRNHGNHRVGV
jgi:hypothetical protein